MDIDLLFTQEGEAGLISNENMVQKAIGVLLDTSTGLLTVEYADMDYLEFNITIDHAYMDVLDQNQIIHLGAVKNGHIAQAYQIPLMFADDPYRSDALKSPKAPAQPLIAFENFIGRCVAGQPVHRDDLDNDETLGCVLGDATPSSLEFAPHLARRHALEAKPQHTPGMNAPGLGLGGSGGSAGGGSNRGNIIPPEDDE